MNTASVQHTSRSVCFTLAMLMGLEQIHVHRALQLQVVSLTSMCVEMQMHAEPLSLQI